MTWATSFQALPVTIGRVQAMQDVGCQLLCMSCDNSNWFFSLCLSKINFRPSMLLWSVPDVFLRVGFNSHTTSPSQFFGCFSCVLCLLMYSSCYIQFLSPCTSLERQCGPMLYYYYYSHYTCYCYYFWSDINNNEINFLKWKYEK